MKVCLGSVKGLALLGAVITLSGCASEGLDLRKKQVLDSKGGKAAPSWVSDSRDTWVGDQNMRHVKSLYSAKGEERLSACYTLAKLNVQEQLVSEIWSEFKAAVSHATDGLSENSEDVFIQSRNNEAKGNIRGLRFSETYHERYVVNGAERIDCYVLAEISEQDLAKMRHQLLNPIVQANPRLKEAAEARHVDFFKSGL